MKERGMIFNEYQVRALLDGSMTQTRRIIKPQPEVTLTGSLSGTWLCRPLNGLLLPKIEDIAIHCPFGIVGDRIWVRETWAQLGNEDGCAIDWNDNLVKDAGAEAARIYRASCTIGDYGLWQIPDDAFWKPHTDDRQYEGSWRPSIHMPRWASRITLEITEVRVERLQDANESSLLDELGAMLEYDDTPAGRAFSHAEHYAIAGVPVGMSPEMHGFKAWWDKVNGAGSFDTNPWCWVIEFRRVEACSG